jgi:hypothetical protein
VLYLLAVVLPVALLWCRKPGQALPSALVIVGVLSWLPGQPTPLPC